MRRALVAAACLPALVPASAAAATMTAPRTARAGGAITVHATGLIPGRYRLFLGVTIGNFRGHEPLTCVGAVSGRVATTGSATFTGTIPQRLVCRFGIGSATGTVAVGRGRYRLLVASPIAPGGFSGRRSFLKRGLQIV